MNRALTLTALLVLIWLGPARADEADLARLEAARAQWQAVQDGDYRFRYRKYCDCNREDPPLTIITVSNSAVSQVAYLHDGTDREIPGREGNLDLYWTVEELFDKLAIAYERAAVVRVQFDADTGFPLSLFIDYDTSFVGDETELRLVGFERL